LVLERGEGPYVFDVHGNRYIDALSSLFCCQIGYPYGDEMAEAAQAQLTRLAFNTNWATAHPPAIELSDRLAALAPEGMRKVFFTNGGSESVEAAWKLVRQYHVANGEGQRTKAIARKVAYHGVTLGALALTGVPRFKEQFGEPAIYTRHVSTTSSFRDSREEGVLCRDLLAELEDTIEEEGPETIAMLIAEPVQNAGGCFTPPGGYWPGLRELCDRYGILLVADEVITGCGRLGEWFAVDRFGVNPDLITLAKGLTSAYAPMGAVVCADRVAAHLYDDEQTLLHGITFGGHPVCAAIALRNIDIFDRDNVLENVRELEPHLRNRLNETLGPIPIVGDVRGAGFFWGFELVKDTDNTRFNAEERERLLRGFLPARLLKAGLIARADDRGDAVLQVAPPLISDRALLDEIVDRLAEVLAGASEFMGIDDQPPGASPHPTVASRTAHTTP
jgi:adenosylmethionine-8-amino-7-oxononanoate aminotransferase